MNRNPLIQPLDDDMTNDTRIEVISRNNITEVVMSQIVAMCTRAFEEDSREVLATFADAVHILVWEQSELVSHALWVTRNLQVADKPPLRTAYVEAVATEPAYQGRGYASIAMNTIGNSIADYQLGGLSPSCPAFYEKFGWELWQGALSIRKGDAILPTPDDEQVMILRLPTTPQIDLTAPLSAEWREGELW